MVWIEAPALGESCRSTATPTPTATAPFLDSTKTKAHEGDEASQLQTSTSSVFAAARAPLIASAIEGIAPRQVQQLTCAKLSRIESLAAQQ